jgi:hypothetical protein
MRLLITLLIVISINSLSAQCGFSPRANSFGINANFGGPGTIASASLDYFVTPAVRLETGIGFFPSAYGGVKIHPWGKTHARITPYIGAIANYSIGDTYSNGNHIMFPAGLHYISNHFSCSIEAELVVLSRTETFYWGAVSFGYRF